VKTSKFYISFVPPARKGEGEGILSEKKKKKGEGRKTEKGAEGKFGDDLLERGEKEKGKKSQGKEKKEASRCLFIVTRYLYPIERGDEREGGGKKKPPKKKKKKKSPC